MSEVPVKHVNLGVGNGELERLRNEFSWDIAGRASLKGGVWSCQGTDHAVSYPAESHDLCFSVESESFWFQFRNRIIRELFHSTVPEACLWEVGAGNGCVAKALQDAGAAVVAVEPNPSAVHRAYERGVKECICGLYEEIQLPSGSVPAIGCFDVIEHVESPETLLEEFHRTLAVGGVLLLSVPALRILWSQSDEYAGHYRRYSRATLDRLLVSCGFRPIKVKYVFAFLLPAIFFLRVLPWRLGIHFERTQLHDRSLRQLSPGIFGRVMGILLRVEHRIGALVNLPFGTSLVAAYRKV